MVNHPAARLDTIFGALADPTRRALLKALSVRSSTVGELATPFAMSLAAVSKHIKVLERAGLVKRTVDGREHRCSLDARPMHAGLEWMRHYERWWNDRLDVLETLLEQEDAAARPTAKRRSREPTEIPGKPKRRRT